MDHYNITEYACNVMSCHNIYIYIYIKGVQCIITGVSLPENWQIITKTLMDNILWLLSDRNSDKEILLKISDVNNNKIRSVDNLW
jgi:hypothetical protein